ncbi:hypothetical protein cyc_00543 [Cyclospora cayetanensis]|uniref:Uncharacterized protein n=1 Tax=Cyclospora cayetanensis TaxID=88456 RepID=A0A1D3D3S8_9EIME|nr:hypothetical protein cyc_00543 [Cyclospora cayetanensis]
MRQQHQIALSSSGRGIQRDCGLCFASLQLFQQSLAGFFRAHFQQKSDLEEFSKQAAQDEARDSGEEAEVAAAAAASEASELLLLLQEKETQLLLQSHELERPLWLQQLRQDFEELNDDYDRCQREHETHKQHQRQKQQELYEQQVALQQQQQLFEIQQQKAQEEQEQQRLLLNNERDSVAQMKRSEQQCEELRSHLSAKERTLMQQRQLQQNQQQLVQQLREDLQNSVQHSKDLELELQLREADLKQQQQQWYQDRKDLEYQKQQNKLVQGTHQRDEVQKQILAQQQQQEGHAGHQEAQKPEPDEPPQQQQCRRARRCQLVQQRIEHQGKEMQQQREAEKQLSFSEEKYRSMQKDAQVQEELKNKEQQILLLQQQQTHHTAESHKQQQQLQEDLLQCTMQRDELQKRLNDKAQMLQQQVQQLQMHKARADLLHQQKEKLQQELLTSTQKLEGLQHQQQEHLQLYQQQQRELETLRQQLQVPLSLKQEPILQQQTQTQKALISPNEGRYRRLQERKALYNKCCELKEQSADLRLHVHHHQQRQLACGSCRLPCSNNCAEQRLRRENSVSAANCKTSSFKERESGPFGSWSNQKTGTDPRQPRQLQQQLQQAQRQPQGACRCCSKVKVDTSPSSYCITTSSLDSKCKFVEMYVTASVSANTDPNRKVNNHGSTNKKSCYTNSIFAPRQAKYCGFTERTAAIDA